MMKFIFLPDTRNLSKKICNYKTDLLFIKKWLTFFSPWLDSFLEMTPIFNWALFSWGGGERWLGVNIIRYIRQT